MNAHLSVRVAEARIGCMRAANTTGDREAVDALVEAEQVIRILKDHLDTAEDQLQSVLRRAK
jgi:uncharacterized protein (DUF2267 family)